MRVRERERETHVQLDRFVQECGGHKDVVEEAERDEDSCFVASRDSSNNHLAYERPEYRHREAHEVVRRRVARMQCAAGDVEHVAERDGKSGVAHHTVDAAASQVPAYCWQQWFAYF